MTADHTSPSASPMSRSSALAGSSGAKGEAIRSPEPRVLVQMFYPLEMRCVGEILTAIAKSYGDAVVDEEGRVLEHRREDRATSTTREELGG